MTFITDLAMQNKLLNLYLEPAGMLQPANTCRDFELGIKTIWMIVKIMVLYVCVCVCVYIYILYILYILYIYRGARKFILQKRGKKHFLWGEVNVHTHIKHH